MATLSKTSLDRLHTCDPRLQDLMLAVIDYVDFTVLCGHRTKEEQDEAVRTKKSKTPWPMSKHNSYPARAVDIAPWLPEVKIDWNDLVAFGRLMGIVQTIAKQKGIKIRFGLDWDGDFRSSNRDPTESFFDAPHVELVD